MKALLKRLGLDGRSVVTAVPYLWLLLFFLIPFVIVLKISFSSAAIAIFRRFMLILDFPTFETLAASPQK